MYFAIQLLKDIDLYVMDWNKIQIRVILKLDFDHVTCNLLPPSRRPLVSKILNIRNHLQPNSLDTIGWTYRLFFFINAG